MTTQTFTEYLVEEADKDSGKAKLFNPQRFVPKIKTALNLMIKAAADKDEPMDEMIIMEMISVFKEVLVSRLKPYADGVTVKAKNGKSERTHTPDGKYKERKDDKDEISTMKSIEKEVKEALIEQFNEKHYRPGINKFVNLVVASIMKEIERVGPVKAVKTLDRKNFTEKAKDSFGALMNLIVKSDIFGNADDAKVAKKTLSKMSATARKESKKTRRLSKGQRLKLIRNAAEKVQR